MLQEKDLNLRKAQKKKKNRLKGKNWSSGRQLTLEKKFIKAFNSL